MEFRSRYSPSKPSKKIFEGESLTLQSKSEECDINNIMNTYRRTGLITHLNEGSPAHLDLTDIGSFHDAFNTVLRAEDMFMQLPATLRKEFDNDPANFLDFVSDEANAEKMAKLGLTPNKKPSNETRSSGDSVPGSPGTESADSAEGVTPEKVESE